MSIFASPRFLPCVMWADAASCAATGALQLAFTELLARHTGLPAALLAATGLFLLVYAVAAAAMACQVRPPRRLIGLVAFGNLGWALACLALMFGSHLALTALGQFWVGAQAVVVVVLAELQWTGLRRTAGQAASAQSGDDMARHRMLKSSSN